MSSPAILALADGCVFHGTALAGFGTVTGEVVFNTAMTGYQEILTDPSYAQQMVCLTYPHIGNTGVNPHDEESPKIWAKGLIIRDASRITSNWRSDTTLREYLHKHNVLAIADIDTRKLTRHIRDHGAQNACISTQVEAVEAAILQAQQAPSLTGLDLAKVVGTEQSYVLPSNGAEKFHVVAYDYGVKRNILNLLRERGCKLTVVPPKMSAAEVLALKPDGIFLSNGPGDPAACDYAITAIQAFLKTGIPLFGICLGFQLLGLASGANTKKMSFGHHGANHPVKDLLTGKVLITSQNHGFAVDESTLPADWEITHRSLFDNTLQGIRHRSLPAFGFQGHPEASPGPHDVIYCFDQFIEHLQQHKA